MGPGGLPHEDLGWYQTEVQRSPTMAVKFRIHRQSYTDLQLPPPRSSWGRPPGPVVRRTVCDTGAQLNVMDTRTLAEMGIDVTSITPTSTRIMGAARGSQLDVKGCIFLEVTIPNNRENKFKNTVPQQFFIASNVKSCYLSRTCLVNIGAIPADFPNPAVGQVQANTVGENVPQECTYDGVGECDCPDRGLPPSQPAALPCAPTQENIPKLEKYIRDRYRSSAFNTTA